MAARKSTKAPASNRKPRPGKRLSRDEADALANFGPAFTDAQMERLEVAASSPARGQQRRVMLAVCATDADRLSKVSLEEPEAFGEMRELVEVFARHARALASCAEAAALRCAIADCRDNAPPIRKVA